MATASTSIPLPWDTPCPRSCACDPALAKLAKIAELAAKLPEVSECHRITGEDCFLLRVHAAGLDTFEETLDKLLLYGQTTTSIVQSTAVAPRTPGLPKPS